MNWQSRHCWPDIHRALLAAGWTYEGATSGHHKYRPPPGRPTLPALIRIPCTPSDHRAYRNARAELRRAGVAVA